MIFMLTARKIAVCLIEDDEDLRDSMARGLELSNFTVHAFASALDFYRQFSSLETDVVIVDLGLPDLDGIEIVKQLTQDHQLGVIILTAKSQLEDRLHGYNAGADIYLVKPVALEELAATINSLAKRLTIASTQISEKTYPWVLDSSAWKLTSPQQQYIALTHKEMLVVTTLINESPKAVSRKILDELIMDDVTKDRNNHLNVLVARLRDKINHAADNENPIRTLYGQGYSFDSDGIIK